MRLLTLTLLAAFLSIVSVNAQTTPKPTGTVIATIPAQTDLLPDQPVPLGKAKRTIIWEIIVMRADNGINEYQVPAASMRLTGDDVDAVPTSVIYSTMCDATAKIAFQYGFAPCVAAVNGWQAKVWTESCVARTGSGTDTRFVPLNGNFAQRFYSIVCGVPTVSLVNTIDPGCTVEGAVVK